MKKLIFKKFARDISSFFIILIISISVIIWIIQAVNYLDLVSEDGHSLKVYFLYTLFSFPKITSKILPFIFMISIFYTILKYENDNELLIYWINGISRVNFINSIIIISFYYLLLQLLLTIIIVPYTLDKGRSFFRSSNVDMFSTVIKEKKFNDTVENLTIYVDSKIENKLNNIVIKEKIDLNESKITIAESGEIINDEKNKKLILKNGKIINNSLTDQNIIEFSEFNLNLSQYNTKTVTNQKTQEMNSISLFKCLKEIKLKKDLLKNKSGTDIKLFKGCNTEISDAILEEFIKRFFMPLFILLIGISSSLILFNNKNEKNSKLINVLIFLLGIFFIFISEVGLSYSTLDITNIYIYIIFPIIISVTLYLIFLLYDNWQRKEID